MISLYSHIWTFPRWIRWRMLSLMVISDWLTFQKTNRFIHITYSPLHADLLPCAKQSTLQLNDFWHTPWIFHNSQRWLRAVHLQLLSECLPTAIANLGTYPGSPKHFRQVALQNFSHYRNNLWSTILEKILTVWFISLCVSDLTIVKHCLTSKKELPWKDVAVSCT